MSSAPPTSSGTKRKDPSAETATAASATTEEPNDMDADFHDTSEVMDVDISLEKNEDQVNELKDRASRLVQLYFEGTSRQQLSEAKKLLSDLENIANIGTGDQALLKLIGQVELVVKLTAEDNAGITSAKKPSRVATPDFDIIETSMEYKGDLQRFAGRVYELFNWRLDKKTRDTYIAPYFPLIQSSGSGKTKIMYEFMKMKKEPPNYVKCVLVLCSKGRQQIKDLQVFSHTLDVSDEPSDEVRDDLWRKLDNMRGGEKNVVLLFDEAQHLTAERNNGWYFRSVRWWLRKKERNKNVVAVFAGTTTGVANFFQEPPESTFSRDAQGVYYENGNKMYPPFFEVTTVGLLSQTNPAKFEKANSEYEVAIQYGRPLFARLSLKDELEKSLPAIMDRMLGGQDSQKGNYSIIATRLQMGQVSFNFASELVATGYAHLVHFSSPEHSAGTGLADIAFLPDPVCAHLAMSQMIEGCSVAGSMKGREPKFWSATAEAFFTSGLCRPEKGDAGEIAAAFYMLACGDELRYTEGNQDLKTFSISFDKWLAKMTDTIVQQETSATISFIQVCRNCLRHRVDEMTSSGLLQHWYKSGRALYAFASCPAYDIVTPIRYGDQSAERYCPLLISVKNRSVYSRDQREAAVKAMEGLFDKGETGVCILLLIGLEDPQPLLKLPSPRGFSSGKVTSFEVIVPQNDKYGATALSQCPTCGGGERAEVMTSHAEAVLGVGYKKISRLLRSTTKEDDESSKFLEEINQGYAQIISTDEFE